MNFLKWIAFGAVGGLIGAAVWAGISYSTGYEVGYIAWGIGALVGVLVRVAAGEKNEGLAPGGVAAAVAIAAVLIGKFAASSMVSMNFASSADLPTMTAEDMIMRAADAIVRDRQSKGQNVIFPNGKTLETAETQVDYPADVWQQASAQWNALPPAEQTKQIEEEQRRMKLIIDAVAGSLRDNHFTSSFGIFDLLWFGLAAFTAYRLGAGNVSED